MQQKTILPIHNEDESKLQPKLQPKQNPKQQQNPKLVALVVVATLFYSLHGIFVNLSRDSNNKIVYKSGTIVLLAEICKFIISSSILFYERKVRHIQIKFSLKEVLWLAVPGIIYTINNNLAIHILDVMDPVTYQLLGNFKILTTTLLSYFWLKKQFSRIQWISLLHLIIGGMLCSKVQDDSSLFNEKNQMSIGVTFYGLILMFIYCLLSSTASISNEYIVKLNDKTSIHYQNAILYAFGILFNFIGLVQQHGLDGDLLKGVFNFWTIVIILNQSIVGLLLSGITKYMDSITKLFVIAGSTIISYWLSYILFGVQITLNFVFAAIIIASAIYLYNFEK